MNIKLFSVYSLIVILAAGMPTSDSDPKKESDRGSYAPDSPRHPAIESTAATPAKLKAWLVAMGCRLESRAVLLLVQHQRN